MGNLRLGQLQHRVDFIRESKSINSLTGEQGISIALLKEDAWAKITYVGSPSAGSSEEELNDQRTGKMKIECTTRFFPSLRFEDVIIFEESYFRIYSIQILGRNEGYVLRAELRDDNSPFLPTGADLQ